MLSSLAWSRLMRHSFQIIGPPIAALVAALALSSPGLTKGLAQTPTTNQPWAYMLLNGSYLLDDCLLCGRPSMPLPMRGTFSLRLIDANPISARYSVDDIQFKAGDRPYRVTGSGTFELGGEVAATLQMDLQVDSRPDHTAWLTVGVGPNAPRSRKLIRWSHTRCVSEHALEHRYPPKKKAARQIRGGDTENGGPEEFDQL